MRTGDLQLIEDFASQELGRMQPAALLLSLAVHGAVALSLIGARDLPRPLTDTPLPLEFSVDFSTAPAPLLDDPLPLPEPLSLPVFAPAPRLDEAIVGSAAPPMPAAWEFSPRRSALAAPRPAAPAAAANIQSEQRQRRAVEDYLRQVIAKLAQGPYITPGGQPAERGLVVARLTVARDGRLLGMSIVESSRFPALDRSVLEAIARAAPFGPLPADIPDASHSFLLPINFEREH